MKFWLRYLMLKITHNYKLCCLLNNWKFFIWLVLCSNFNNSSNSSSNSTFWGCFGILRTSRIQNCHWNLIFSKNSLRKTGKRPRQVKVDRLYVVLHITPYEIFTVRLLFWLYFSQQYYCIIGEAREADVNQEIYHLVPSVWCLVGPRPFPPPLLWWAADTQLSHSWGRRSLIANTVIGKLTLII